MGIAGRPKSYRIIQNTVQDKEELIIFCGRVFVRVGVHVIKWVVGLQWAGAKNGFSQR